MAAYFSPYQPDLFFSQVLNPIIFSNSVIISAILFGASTVERYWSIMYTSLNQVLLLLHYSSLLRNCKRGKKSAIGIYLPEFHSIFKTYSSLTTLNYIVKYQFYFLWRGVEFIIPRYMSQITSPVWYLASLWPFWVCMNMIVISCLAFWLFLFRK